MFVTKCFYPASLFTNFAFGLIFLLVILSANSLSFAQQIPQLQKKIHFTKPLKKCAEFRTNKVINVNSESDNAKFLYVAFLTGKIEKINLEKKTVIWNSDLGGDIISDLTIENSNVFVLTKISKTSSKKSHPNGYLANVNARESDDFILWSLNAETGITNWRFPFETIGEVNLDTYLDKLFLTEQDGKITVINKRDAQVIWNKNLKLRIDSPPFFDEEKIYFSSQENHIIIASINTGEIISRIPTINPPQTLLADGNKIYWGDKKGFVNFVDTADKKSNWKVQFGGAISDLTLTSNAVLVSSLDNFVYLISLQKGKTIWKKRLSGRVLGKPLILDEFAVIVTPTDNNAVVLNSRDGRLVNQILLTSRSSFSTGPIVINSSLVFLTNEGIFSFVAADINCGA